MKLFILLCMVFCHIVDDYYLQGILASMKQKSWWERNAPDKMYKHDYIMVLLMHSFSWSFIIMLSCVVYLFVIGKEFSLFGYALYYFSNMSIHAITDNLKANKKKINLIQYQTIHLCK